MYLVVNFKIISNNQDVMILMQGGKDRDCIIIGNNVFAYIS